MNRRTLIALGTAAATLPLLGLKSCTEQQSTLAVLTQTLGNAIASLIEIMGDTAVAARLREHTATAVTLINSWRSGMSTRDVIAALNRIIDDLTGINFAERYRPLVVFTLGTIAAIIETIRQQSNGQGEEPHTKIRLTAAPHDAAEFRHTWDAIRAGSPDLTTAPVL